MKIKIAKEKLLILGLVAVIAVMLVYFVVYPALVNPTINQAYQLGVQSTIAQLIKNPVAITANEVNYVCACVKQ